MSLGYTAGAQMVSSEVSPLPGDGLFVTDYGTDSFDDAVLMCSSPSGEDSDCGAATVFDTRAANLHCQCVLVKLHPCFVYDDII